MIVLDTNILSELMRPAPEAAVEQWLAEQPEASVFISAITEAELRYGAKIMPPGKRQAALAAEVRRSDCRHRTVARRRSRYAQRAGFRGMRRRGHQPMGRTMKRLASSRRRYGLSRWIFWTNQINLSRYSFGCNGHC